MTPHTDMRRSKIAKIKIASKTLALDDGSYRALLQRITGKDSAAAMTMQELDAVLEEFKRLGFKAKKKRAGDRRQSGNAQAGKIRALWLMLYHMGAAADSSEHALAKFCKRSCGVEDLHWVDERRADQVIRALRGWMERLGYSHPTVSAVKQVGYIRAASFVDDEGTDFMTLTAKINLVRWQCSKLGIHEVLIGSKQYTLQGCFLASSEELDAMIDNLGDRIRQ